MTHASTRASWTLTSKFNSVSCGVIAPFSWVLADTMCVCVCPPRVCFPSPIKFCFQTPLVFKVKFPNGSWSLCCILRFWKTIVCHKSTVCDSSSWRLYGRVNCDLLQEDLCHMLDDPGLLQSELLPSQQATANSSPCRRHSNIQRQKTTESPLDCQWIKPAIHKGNQP